jgi:prephenate dehydratase
MSAPEGLRRIAYLGPHGTFSEEALLGESQLAGCELFPVATIEDAVEAAASGVANASFVPYENSITGLIEATRHSLDEHPELTVDNLYSFEVHLNLLGLAGSAIAGIELVVSHPEALRQCRQFLTDRLPGARLEVADSTSAAARGVATVGDPSVAAVASSRAAEVFDLEVLAGRIEDESGNRTRFALVRRRT